MRPSVLILVLAACVLAAAGCARKKGFEKPGFAYGCPIGEVKVSSMEDLIAFLHREASIDRDTARG